MADGNPNQIIWKEYREPLVHKCKHFYEVQIQTTHAVVRWAMGEKKGTFYVRNDFGKHAEVIVKEHLSDILKAGPEAKMTVQIYQNFSPCKNCSSELIKFKKDESVDLTIIFGGLYNIKRQGCLEKNCIHVRDFPIDEGESDKNKTGLQNLSDAGIRARTFTPDDWKFLYKYLDEPSLERPEDRRMKKDYEDIVPPDAVDEVAGMLAGANIN